MVSFAQTSSRGDSSYIHNSMPKDMESLQKGKSLGIDKITQGKEC